MVKKVATDQDIKQEEIKILEPNVEECFVIMPISDREPYTKGHFQKIYKNLFAPAIEAAGFKPVRADDIKETNLIHHDILNRLISAPLALCDLSSLNANVFFELGIRQAFDKPVILVQEINTPQVFDISGIRVLEYRNKNQYEEIQEDQKRIAASIRATVQSKSKTNSLISLLSITNAAAMKQVGKGTEGEMITHLVKEIDVIKDQNRNIQKFIEISTRNYSAERQKHNQREQNGDPLIHGIEFNGEQYDALTIDELASVIERSTAEQLSELHTNFDMVVRDKTEVSKWSLNLAMLRIDIDHYSLEYGIEIDEELITILHYLQRKLKERKESDLME